VAQESSADTVSQEIPNDAAKVAPPAASNDGVPVNVHTADTARNVAVASDGG